MKIYIILSLLLMSFCSLNAQIVAEPLKTYCLGDSKSSFNSSLSHEFKKIFDEILLKEKIDTSSCEMLKFDDFIGIYKTEKLDQKVYTYISFQKDKGNMRKYTHYSYNCFENSKNNKLLFIYFKSDRSDYEELIMYYIQK